MRLYQLCVKRMAAAVQAAWLLMAAQRALSVSAKLQLREEIKICFARLSIFATVS